MRGTLWEMMDIFTINGVAASVATRDFVTG